MSKIDQIHLRAVMLCMSKMSKIHQIHLRAVMLCMSKMSKMSKIHQIHLRAVMLCMSKMSKMGKEHTHTFWLITSLILLMDFQSGKSFGKLRLRAFQPYHQILCILKHVRDVGDRSSTPKGCNAIYVRDVEDGKRTYTHILAHNFLNT